ncbi:MAG: translation initiation factor IF-3 [Bdellovibrionales bacterium]|nr:translation initiation factor IF-3 [Bdellovibrionales bacterium]
MPNSKKGGDGFRVNHEIFASQVRVIDSDGKMAGIFTVAEAIRLAESRGLDLIEVAPDAKPPTCKIIDYGKWKYENKKKEKDARKKQTIITIKEIQVRPRTDQHDLETKLKHARRFLLEGDKVKVNLRFQGREMAHQEQGMALLNKITAALNDVAVPETPAKREGRQMFVLLAPDPLKIKEYLKAHPEQKEPLTEAKGDVPNPSGT